MEIFLLIVLTVSTVVFFFKWRKAAESNAGPMRRVDGQPGGDPIYMALMRLERKVDALALGASRPQVTAPMTPMTPIVPEPIQEIRATVPATPLASPPATVATPASEPYAARPEQPASAVVRTGAINAPASQPEGLAALSALAEKPSLGSETTLELPTTPHANPTEAPVYEPPAWEREARAILSRIWSWVLVGEEFRPKGVPLEFAMAGTWLMRVGVVVLVSCVVWFLKWSMVHGILGPSGRVGLSFVSGVALTVFGYRMMGKRYQVMGQGLMGGGIAALYFAAYASGPMYHLLPQLACFAMMALITLAGCVLASGTRSQVTAILAMMGGYATPILLSTGVPNFPGLFSYMFLLGGGILFLAILRNWRLLHYLAFAAHWVLVFGSLRAYEPARDFHVVLPFLIAFFLQQHGVGIGYAFRRAVPISILEAIQQFLHAGLFAGVGYWLIDGASGRPWPALLAIGLGFLFALQTLAVLKRMPKDRLSLSVSLGLAGFFTAWSVPLLFNGSSLTVAWSLMALAWLWTGLRIRSQLLVIGSQVLFLLAGIRLGAVDFGRSFLHDGPDASFGEYLKGFSLRIVNFGVFIGSMFIASRLYRTREHAEAGNEAKGLRVSPEADLPFSAPVKMAGAFAFIIGFLFLFITVHFEAEKFLGFHPPLKSPGIILIWTAFAAYLAVNGRKLVATGFAEKSGAAIFSAAALILVCLRMMVIDWGDMGVSPGAFRFEDSGLQFFYRLAAHGSLLALIWACGTGRFGLSAAPDLAKGYRVSAVGLLFLIVTLEIRTVSHAFLPAFEAGALSLAWALFAMALVALGLRHNDRSSRFGGLILFGVVAVKVFLFDLANLDMIWRVLSFLSVGAVLLLGSFAYLRASKSDGPEEPEKGKA